jgi:aryl-alcohol dehydrogenase-like predicted oxidoreductase
MELIDCGKIRHFAISNYSAWQSLRILNLCDANGWPRPVMTQMIYNALVRQIEFEYVSFCRTHDLHLTVYNPLAGGLLTGKYASLADEGAGARFRDNPMYRTRYWSERFFQGMLGLKRIADEAGASLTHLALNWVVQGGNVDSVLLGPSSAAQLQDCLAAMQHPLSEATMDRIRAFLLEWEGTNATYAR